jgi:hypothetical protein
MRRTTLALEEGLVTAMKKRAVRERTSMTELANRLLRDAMRQTRTPEPPYFEWRTFNCGGPPLVDLNDRDALLDAMEE